MKIKIKIKIFASKLDKIVYMNWTFQLSGIQENSKLEIT